jgi:hypothetical protein
MRNDGRKIAPAAIVAPAIPLSLNPMKHCVSDEDAELRGTRPRQHIHQSKSVDEGFLVDPFALLLDLGLHDAHDCRPAAAHRADLKEHAGNLGQTDGVFLHAGLRWNIAICRPERRGW